MIDPSSRPPPQRVSRYTERESRKWQQPRYLIGGDSTVEETDNRQTRPQDSMAVTAIACWSQDPSRWGLDPRLSLSSADMTAILHLSVFQDMRQVIANQKFFDHRFVDIPANVRRAREALHLSQEELA